MVKYLIRLCFSQLDLSFNSFSFMQYFKKYLAFFLTFYECLPSNENSEEHDQNMKLEITKECIIDEDHCYHIDEEHMSKEGTSNFMCTRGRGMQVEF